MALIRQLVRNLLGLTREFEEYECYCVQCKTKRNPLNLKPRYKIVYWKRYCEKCI